MTTLSIIIILFLFILLALSLRRVIADAFLKGEVERLRIENQELAELRRLCASLQTELEVERSRAGDRDAFLQQSEARLNTAFENLSRSILEERGRALGEENSSRMNQLMQPFRDQLDSFRQRVDAVHRDDTELAGQLKEQLVQLMNLNARVGEEASSLVRAIKGDSKKQGDWGELIIERIFEDSGLSKDREYTVQESFRNDEGDLVRPDFIVSLPGNKSVIVDSKVSLTAYERYSGLEGGEEKASALREHVASVKRHVAELQQKDYTGIGGNRTLDFVIMCIPVEPAWQSAMEGDPELLYELAGKNVVICGPTTLMITLKLIAQLWRREKENRNAELIAAAGGKIYDQVVLVAEALSEARRRLSAVEESFDLAQRRLSDGRGNLVRRVEAIRSLGAKVSRSMPEETADASRVEEV
ncbi:MAG: DNA recombination protein RmuC [Chlorobium sp.]|nr:DNA recombination protein RmuC [Chlorobium sp.]